MATTLATVVRRFRLRPVRSGLVLVCSAIALSLLASNAVAFARFALFRSEIEAAFAPPPSGRLTEADWTFPFQNSRVAITVPVEEAELAAAMRLDTSGVFRSPRWLREPYISEVVAAQAASPLVGRMAGELRRIRDDRGLDPDEYLELITHAVQAIPYGQEGPSLLAAQVLAGGQGVCSGKSLLLGSLLVHEGYETVMWIFPTQNHVALGVASDGAHFLGTRYAFVEATGPAFVGQVSSSYRGLGPSTERPKEIALGGWRSYGSGHEVEAILAELRRAKRTAAAADPYAAYARLSGSHRERYMERTIESMAADGTIAFILANTHDRREAYSVVIAAAR